MRIIVKFALLDETRQISRGNIWQQLYSCSNNIIAVLSQHNTILNYNYETVCYLVKILKLAQKTANEIL